MKELKKNSVITLNKSVDVLYFDGRVFKIIGSVVSFYDITLISIKCVIDIKD